MTDGNGNRVTNVVDAGYETIQRQIGGLLWWFETGSGEVWEAGGYPFHVGTTCTGQVYGYSSPSFPPTPQRLSFDRGSRSYFGFSTLGPFLCVADDDSVSWTSPGGACVTTTFRNENEHPQTWTGLWPLTPAVAPSDLPGPLTISAQN